MKRHYLAGVLLAALTGWACERGERAPSAPPAPAASEVPLMAARAPQAVSDSRAAAQPTVVPRPGGRKVIRNGSLNLEVPSIEKSFAAIKAFVQSVGGYIASQSEGQDINSVKTASLTCRIPSERLDAALEKFKALGKLENLAINAEDITEQYFNLEIRIGNQKQLEARLLELLRRPTNRLADLLEIEREVARVRGGIDQMEGQKRFWDNQVDFSTLVINLHEPRPIIGGEEGGALRILLRSFREAGDNFVLTLSGIIGLSGAVIPVLAVLGSLLWLATRLWKRRKRSPA